MNRVAIVRPFPVPLKKGFYNAQEIGLAKGLAKKGVNVDVYVVSDSNQPGSYQISDDTSSAIITVYELRMRRIPLISQAYYPDLIETLKQHRYMLIQVNEENEITSFLVSEYARKAKIPCIVYQGMYQTISGRIQTVFQWFYNRLVIPRFKSNLCYGLCKTTTAQAYLQRKGYQNIRVLPVGLDTGGFAEREDIDWKAKLALPDDAIILLYVGILEPRRNPDFLIDLARHLQTENTYLLIAGSGPSEARLRQRIQDEQIYNIHLLGPLPQKNLPSLYESADFFLLASDYEIYGMVVLEALYFGCPVISTATAGPSDIILEGENGFVIDSLDIEHWARTIMQHHREMPRRQIASRTAKHLTWDSIANVYLQFYRDAEQRCAAQNSKTNAS